MAVNLPRAGADVTEAIRPELGRRYRTRDGRITSELRANFEGSPYPFVAEVNGERRSWDVKGQFSSFAWPAPCDLVEVLPKTIVGGEGQR